MFKTRKRKIIALVTITIFILVILLHIYMNRPSVGVITVDGSNVSAKNSFNFTPVKLSDKYISFSVPKSLVKAPNNPQYAPQVDQFNFSYKDSQTWDLSISTDNVNYSINSNSGYVIRKNNPQQYSESEQTVDGGTAYVFEDKTAAGFSKAAFMQHGSYQASVALTGDDGGIETNLQKTFNQVLSSWHWLVP